MSLNEREPYSQAGPIQVESANRNVLSRRTYNLALSLFILFGFVVMGLAATYTSTPQFLYQLASFGLVGMLLFLAASIGGLLLMSMAKANENLTMSIVGYLLFVFSFGFTASIGLMYYDMATISNALLATAGITAVFGALGIAFPSFFQKIQGVLVGALLALIIVELVMMFMGVSQTWIDGLVVLVFCGFIGYDSYRASFDEPTLTNAVFNASQLFVDIVNVFLRLLSIFGRRD